jgi:hypothetical protein
MLYDNVYYLGHIFQVFLRENSDLLKQTPSYHSSDAADAASAERTLIERRLLEWLDMQGYVTDLDQRMILLQMAREYRWLESGDKAFQTLVTL